MYLYSGYNLEVSSIKKPQPTNQSRPPPPQVWKILPALPKYLFPVLSGENYWNSLFCKTGRTVKETSL